MSVRAHIGPVGGNGEKFTGSVAEYEQRLLTTPAFAAPGL
jgi:hypothetical protein